MYDRESLESLYKSDLLPIAESLGLTYTTKGETIEAILTASSLPVQETLIVEPVEVKSVKPVIPNVYPTDLYQRLGQPIGSDGDKKRYRLDGTPIN